MSAFFTVVLVKQLITNCYIVLLVGQCGVSFIVGGVLKWWSRRIFYYSFSNGGPLLLVIFRLNFGCACTMLLFGLFGFTEMKLSLKEKLLPSIEFKN